MENAEKARIPFNELSKRKNSLLKKRKDYNKTMSNEQVRSLLNE